VPIVKKTFGNVKYLEFYSDTKIPDLPTTVVSNTEHGHCGKMRDMLQNIAPRMPADIDWLVIVDDDTIIK
jgi:hypothetical protein